MDQSPATATMARSIRPNGSADIDREIQRAESMAELATIVKGLVKDLEEFKKEINENRREVRKWAMGILGAIATAIILNYLKLPK